MANNTKPTILVVDDDPGMGKLITAVLGKHNYEVNYFTSPKKALTCLGHNPVNPHTNGSGVGVNLLLTDLQMPEMTGLELARQVKTLYPGLPVIVMSGSADGRDRDEIFALGADFIAKPFELADLLARIDSRIARPVCSGRIRE